MAACPGRLRPVGSQMSFPPFESSSSFLELGFSVNKRTRGVIRDRKRRTTRHADVTGG